MGTALTGALAGCSELSDEEYENLQEHPVYIDTNLALSLPDTIQTVDKPEDAYLILLPDTPDTAASQAVEWLQENQVIALLGGGAWGTWLSWVETEAYEKAFEHPDLIGEGLEDSQLLIAWASPATAGTAQFELGSDPSDSDFLTALDDNIDSVEPQATRRGPKKVKILAPAQLRSCP